MQPLLEHLDWLDDQQPAMVALVQSLANVNSGTMNLEGLAKVREMLVESFALLGGDLRTVPVAPLETVNANGELVQQPLGEAIHICKRPDIRPRVLLCIHMDTVYGIQHPFQTCTQLDEQRLNGPGVADAKGGLVVMLRALQTLERSPLADRLGWEVIINPDEELGSPGSASFLKERASQADVGLLFEPTLPDGTMVSWRKGTGNFSFVVKGRAAHSGRDFANGRNAIVALARLINRIDQLNTDPDVTYNAGRIEGGGALNMVPDLAIGRVNVRVKTAAQATDVHQHFERLVDETNRADGISCELHGGFSSPPKVIDDATRELQTLIESCGSALQMKVHWRGTGGACDGNKFAAAGLANIDTLGPYGGNIHTPDEFLLVDSLVPRAKLTALVLLNLVERSSV